MRAKDRIEKAVKAAGLDGNIYKGYEAADGKRGVQYGWWLRPFNHSPIYLGQSKAEALDTIDRLTDE